MRPVVIEMRGNKPVIISCPKKVQVIIREPRKRSLKKRLKTAIYYVKTFCGF